MSADQQYADVRRICPAGGRIGHCRLLLSLACFVMLALALAPSKALPQSSEDKAALAEAARLNEEAVALYRAGKYAQAVPLLQRALAIQEKALGPEHPDVALSLNNLAGLYHAQGRYADAEPLLRRALEIMEKVLGPEHPHTATSLNNLAKLYRFQGRLAEAEPLCRRAIAIDEKVYGPDNPEVARDLENYALLLHRLNRDEDAAALEVRAAEIRRKHTEREAGARKGAGGGTAPQAGK